MSKIVLLVCSLILLLGLLAAWDMLTSLVAGRISFNVIVLLIPIGIGLFLGRAAARTAASVVFSLVYLLSGIALVVAWFGKATIRLAPVELPAANAFPVVGVIVAVVCCVTALLHWLLYTPAFDEHLE